MSTSHRGHRDPAPPDLFDDVDTAMSDPDPLRLLSLVSTLLSALDPRGGNRPLAERDNTADLPSRADLVTMLIAVDQPESTVLLTTIGALANDDDILSARIRRELAQRPAAGPPWLGGLADTAVHRAVRMSDALGDGDNIMLGVRLADGHQLTVVAYVDHNLGGLVKDAFVVSAAIIDAVAQYKRMADERDLVWEELGLADARAWLADAIKMSTMSSPPIESETWPACRVLIEWIIRKLPEGGCGYQRPQWNSEDLAALKDRFFASGWGRPLDDPNFRALLDALLWYATDYGSGDPLRWGRAKIGVILEGWLPRKVVASREILAKAPDLLWSFVNFAHGESGVPAEWTEETLAAIDTCAPEYLRMIRTLPEQPVIEDPHWSEELQLDDLAQSVGGPEHLDHLDNVPLPDESFDWSGIADDITAKVAEVLALADRCCAEFLSSVEYRTVTRRVLARVAIMGPSVFRRKASSATAAAALVWIAGKANGLIDSRSDIRSTDIARYFGVKSSPSQRGEVMLRAGGFRNDTRSVQLDSPGYLVAARRAWIIDRRDWLRARIDTE